MKRYRLAKPLVLLIVLLLLSSLAPALWPPVPDLSALAGVGEKYDVLIRRDAWGVPHIFGKTDADAAYGLAYAHAEDDFVTIQQTLLAARGQLASVYGPDAAPNDYMVHLLRIWDVVEARYDSDLTPEFRHILEAYADGLNHYAALHPDEVLLPEAFPVTGEDVVAGSVHKSPLFFDLDDVLAELFEDTRQKELSPRPGAFLPPEFDPAGRLSASRSAPVVFSPFSLAGLGPVLGQFHLDSDPGSNTFSISPLRTPDGATYLAVNSHQPWEGPTTWYEAHVHSEEGWDMAGALFPGSPVVIHGHNRDLGWAFTVNHPDLADVYVLEINPQNPNQYRFDGEWRDFEVRQAPIRVRLFARFSVLVQQEVLWSVYGPAVRRPHGVYALRYAGYGKVNIWQQLYRMNKARDFAGWQAAVKDGGLPNFNIGYADRQGHIYYLYNAMLPLRKEGYQWKLYLPGDTSDTLWTETLPFEDLPQVFDPPSGFIQNANSTPFQTTLDPYNPDPVAFSSTFGIETYMTNRALRALELFGGDDSITFDEFKAYKYDWSYSAQSDMPRLVEMITSATWPAGDADLQQAQQILRDWDFQMHPASSAPALVSFTLSFLLQENPRLRVSQFAGQPLEPAAVRSAFEKAVRYVKEKHGRVDVPWAQVNRLGRGTLNLGLGGGIDVLHAVYGRLQEDGWFKGFQGDCYIMLVRWDAGGQVESYSIHQYGSATLHPESPHYADQAPLFVQRQLKPVWFDLSEVLAHLEREYRPGDE